MVDWDAAECMKQFYSIKREEEVKNGGDPARLKLSGYSWSISPYSEGGRIVEGAVF
jgi:hypothetical protein